jgi:hypothetical protein
MLNRYVEIVQGKDKHQSPDSDTYTFDQLLQHSNVILLGEPGAGKTHLFKSAATIVNGKFLPIRLFLVSRTDQLSNQHLFIDGLDEKRSGRNDNSVIDEIARKLMDVTQAKVFISCRERDWLGDTDLAVLNSYFENNGGVIVLRLKPLSRDEQVNVLESAGYMSADEFLTHAEQKELHDFLNNPQSLLMMAEVVKQGSWLETRLELFAKSANILLKEHNPIKSRAAYDSAELIETAGAICAMRLFSDVDGISVEDSELYTSYPSYRTVSLCEKDKVRAALQRRLFVNIPGVEAVDYVHRTLAEYLAAVWLAKEIKNGLPIRRIKTLFSHDGGPTSELRGLHAWLPVLLPEHCKTFIDADPLGVLIYADASSLSISAKLNLLSAMEKLSEDNPWFYSRYDHNTSLPNFIEPGILSAVESYLEDITISSRFRILLLDIIDSGKPFSALTPSLLKVATEEHYCQAERTEALNCLSRLNLPSNTVRKLFDESTDQDEGTLVVKAHILTQFYQHCLEPKDVADILMASLKLSNKLPIGSLWNIASCIPVSEVQTIFQLIPQHDAAKHNGGNNSELIYVLDKLLLKYLTQQDTPPDTVFIWDSLSKINAYQGIGYNRDNKELKSQIAQNVQLLTDLIDHAVTSYSDSHRTWGLFDDIQRTLLFAASTEIVLIRIVNLLVHSDFDIQKKISMARTATTLCFRSGNVGLEFFDILQKLFTIDSTLSNCADDLLSSEIDEFRAENNLRSYRAKRKELARLRKNIEDFQNDIEKIAKADHVGWLEFLGNTYWGRFNHSKRELTPAQKLAYELGDTNLIAAVAGIKAIIGHNQFPTWHDVSKLILQNKYRHIWYTSLAALTEYWNEFNDIPKLSDDAIKAVLAIDLVCHVENNGSIVKHQWESVLINRNVELAIDTYKSLFNMTIGNKKITTLGFEDLIRNNAFEHHRNEIVFYLLENYPEMSEYQLKDTLKLGLKNKIINNDLFEIASKHFNDDVLTCRINKTIWLALLFITGEKAPEDHPAYAEKEFIWQTRELLGFLHGNNGFIALLTLEKLKLLTKIGAQLFPNEYHPSGTSYGDHNSWDGAEFVRGLINTVSASVSREAGSILAELLDNPTLATYENHLKYAIANHKVRYREALYKKPDWHQTIQTLSNQQPANIQDFHALLVEHLLELKTYIASSNADLYKQFWNEDSYSKITTPKTEESARDVLLHLLRQRLLTKNIIVEPEAHMLNDKRADIAAMFGQWKVPVELKRDYHAEVWNAAETQLQRLYTIDSYSHGYGIYVVFWYGDKRTSSVRANPTTGEIPKSAKCLEYELQDRLLPESQTHITVIVFDVSGNVL